MAKTVLVVDDDPTQRRLIQAVLEREGFAVDHAENGDQAISRLGAGAAVDVILLDLVMPGITGQDTLKELRARGHGQPVIVITAKGGIDTVVEAMQAGAVKGEVDRLKKRTMGRTTFDDLIGESAPMVMVKRLGERAAKSSIPILIT